MSKGFKVALLAICFGLLALRVLPSLPTLNCTKDEINIRTGKGRHSRYVALMRISETTFDTPLSSAITRPVRETDIEAWQTVNMVYKPFQPCSPHYHFHLALDQAAEAGSLLDSLNAPAERRAEVATEILKAWQTTRSYEGARKVLSMLYSDAIGGSNKSFVATGVPAPQR